MYVTTRVVVLYRKVGEAAWALKNNDFDFWFFWSRRTLDLSFFLVKTPHRFTNINKLLVHFVTKGLYNLSSKIVKRVARIFFFSFQRCFELPKTLSSVQRTYSTRPNREPRTVTRLSAHARTDKRPRYKNPATRRTNRGNPGYRVFSTVIEALIDGSLEHWGCDVADKKVQPP